MTADKLVSVIIPVYNAEKHLAATLTSIINQDYDNLEIVIVNDASTDSSRDIAQKLLAESGRESPPQVTQEFTRLGANISGFATTTT